MAYLMVKRITNTIVFTVNLYAVIGIIYIALNIVKVPKVFDFNICKYCSNFENKLILKYSNISFKMRNIYI